MNRQPCGESAAWAGRHYCCLASASFAGREHYCCLADDHDGQHHCGSCTLLWPVELLINGCPATTPSLMPDKPHRCEQKECHDVHTCKCGRYWSVDRRWCKPLSAGAGERHKLWREGQPEYSPPSNREYWMVGTPFPEDYDRHPELASFDVVYVYEEA